MAVWIHNHETKEKRLIDASQLSMMTRAGWSTSKEAPAVDEPESDDDLTDLKAKAKELKIKGYGKMNADTLKAKIMLAEQE